MRTLRITIVAIAGLMGADQARAQAGDGVGRLGWLAGCWELRAGARLTHEQWMAPLGGLMMGMSRTVVRDTTREFEYLRIEVRAGSVAYVARPSGQTETVFPAATVSDSLVIFSNPEHDFPQRIIYRPRGTDSLVARIEGNRNGQVRGIDFPMRRTGCSG